MYRWILNVHLLLGLFAGMFMMMYGASAVQMAHPKWFNLRPRVSESRIEVPAEYSGGPRAVARALMSQHGLRGELTQVKETAAGWSFRIVRPGTVYQVDCTRNTSTARLRTSVAGFMGMLNRIHHIGGLWHEFSWVNAWGLFVGIVSAALIGIALSGLYLWFKIHTERRIGAILLALSLVYSLTLMVLIRVG